MERHEKGLRPKGKKKRGWRRRCAACPHLSRKWNLNYLFLLPLECDREEEDECPLEELREDLETEPDRELDEREEKEREEEEP